jgi:hypothetical protein
MLKRVRWFLLGAASMFGALAYLSNQVRRARGQLTPETMARTGALSVAEALNAAATRIKPEDRTENGSAAPRASGTTAPPG